MLHKFPLYFAPANEHRTIHLYLPDAYEANPEERYPVLYMFDGQNLFYDSDATFGKCWGIRQFLDHWDKPLIVVGMECSHHGNDRIREYCPYEIYSRFCGGKVVGTGLVTMQWVVDVVKPYIDQHYRTWPHREATAIGGSSMGGMMALYAVIAYNRVFSKSAAVSPAFFRALPHFLADIRSHYIDPDTRLFMSWGTEEDRRGYTTQKVLRTEEAMQQRGASTWLYHQQGGLHCEASWQEQVPTWMHFLWK